MKSRNTNIIIFCFILATTLTGAGIGVVLTNIIDSGYFIQWELLGSPPGGAVEILGAEISKVYVKNNEGDSYSCSTLTNSTCWEENNWPPEEQLQESFRLEEDIFRIRNSPVQVDKVSLQPYEPHSHKIQVKYIISENGSVWRWFHSVNFMDFHQFYWPVFLGFFGFCAGLILTIKVVVKSYF